MAKAAATMGLKYVGYDIKKRGALPKCLRRVAIVLQEGERIMVKLDEGGRWSIPTVEVDQKDTAPYGAAWQNAPDLGRQRADIRKQISARPQCCNGRDTTWYVVRGKETIEAPRGWQWRSTTELAGMPATLRDHQQLRKMLMNGQSG